jgi:hypothetical protein
MLKLAHVTATFAALAASGCRTNRELDSQLSIWQKLRLGRSSG